MFNFLQNKHSAIAIFLNPGTNGFNLRLFFLKPVVQLVVFALALHFVYLYIGVYNHISDRPCSIHSSAQCQRASVAQNYYRVDMNFFEPRIQRFNSDDGITGLEFPVIYYLAALLYKLFGFNEMYLRLMSLVIISVGFVFFFLLTNKFLKNTIVSTLAVCALLLSPVLMFYGANFMPDAPGLGFTLLAWYFFFRYAESADKRHLYFYIFFGTMGALIKAVSAMCFAIVFCLLVLDWLKKFKSADGGMFFKKKSSISIGTLVGVLVVAAWYWYAKWLSEFHGNTSFAMVPVMVEDMEMFNHVMGFLKNWRFQYYPPEMYGLLILSVLAVLISFKKLNKILFAITVLYTLACICYVYLFFYQFAHHDYYFIALMPLACFLILTAADLLNKMPVKYQRVLMITFAMLLIVEVRSGLINCKENYKFRFDSREYLGGDYRAYYDLEPKMRALGITRQDKIVSAFDDSYSNSLYFMNQPGYTVEGMYQRDTILHALNAPGVKYLVVNDSAKFNKLYPNALEKNIIIVHRGLIVYKLK